MPGRCRSANKQPVSVVSKDASVDLLGMVERRPFGLIGKFRKTCYASHVLPERFSCRIYGALIEGGRILLTRSRFIDREFVNFPGGGLELGESPLAALRREYAEETGIEIRPLRVLYASEGLHLSSHLPMQIVSIFWLVERTAGELRRGGNGDDVLDLFWVDLDRIPTEEMFPSDKEFAQRLPALLKPEFLLS